MNLADKAKSLGFEEVEFREMLQLFVETCLSDLERLQGAIDRKQSQMAAAAAHSMKGAARSFGLDELARKAEIIELEASGNDLHHCGDIAAAIRLEIDEILQLLQTSDSVDEA